MRLKQSHPGLGLYPFIAPSPPTPPPVGVAVPFSTADLSRPLKLPRSSVLEYINESLTFSTQPTPAFNPKFNPSIAYIQLNLNDSLSSQLSRMLQLKAANPWLRGFEVFWTWARLENPSLVGGSAQYDGSWATGDQTNVNNQRGFRLMDTFVNAAASIGCQFMFHLYSFGGGASAGSQSATFPSFWVPAYLAGSVYGPNTVTSNGVFGAVWQNSYSSNTVGVSRYIRYWTQLTMDRLISMGIAYGNQYDSNPNVETFSFLDESAVNQQTGYNDSGAAATTLGVGGYFQALRAAWPTTQLRWWNNYLTTISAMDTFMAEAKKYNWTMGGPDTANEAPYANSDGIYRSIAGDWRYRGFTAALGDGGVNDPALPNYVGVAHNMREVEGEDLSYDIVTHTTIANGRHIGDGVFAHLVAQANLMGATHMVWFDNTFTGPDRNRTNTAHPNLLDFMNSALQGGSVNVNGAVAGISLTNTSRPSSW